MEERLESLVPVTITTPLVQDTGVSVRKRVIKILKDICLEFPDYPRIPEICVKIIRRINDEEGIRKLVMEVFHNMWFAPISERKQGRGAEHHLLVTKVCAKHLFVVFFYGIVQYDIYLRERAKDVVFFISFSSVADTGCLSQISDPGSKRFRIHIKEVFDF
jgi:hypothetical protein